MNEAASIATENTTKQLPPLIEFSRLPVEDVNASKKAGHYVAKDVDYVTVTTRNGKGDGVIWKYDTFKANWEREANANRIPRQWLERAIANYERWNSGQDVPLDGTAILGWGIISPAQQQMLIHLNVKTIEHLAQANDELRTRIGMGALDLQRKAQAWLSQLREKGPSTMEIASLKQTNDIQSGQIATLTKQVEALVAQLRMAPSSRTFEPSLPMEAAQSERGIAIEHILPEDVHGPVAGGTVPVERPEPALAGEI
mgnify:CR=1 FL=1